MTTHYRPRTKNIELEGQINDDIPCFIDGLLNDIWDKVNIFIENNSGGYIRGAVELIKNIRSTENTRYYVNAKGLLASSASILYFYLLLHLDDDKLRNVTILKPCQDIDVIFHRLRDYDSGAVIIPSDNETYDIDSGMNSSQISKFVDDVFEEAIKYFEYIYSNYSDKNKGLESSLKHSKQRYYAGEDIELVYKADCRDVVNQYLDGKGE